MICQDGKALLYCFDNEIVRIEPWGKNALRVRATYNTCINDNDWALTEPVEETESCVTTYTDPNAAAPNGFYEPKNDSYTQITN